MRWKREMDLVGVEGVSKHDHDILYEILKQQQQKTSKNEEKINYI